MNTLQENYDHMRVEQSEKISSLKGEVLQFSDKQKQVLISMRAECVCVCAFDATPFVSSRASWSKQRRSDRPSSHSSSRRKRR
jgi:hypothetical protein